MMKKKTRLLCMVLVALLLWALPVVAYADNEGNYESPQVTPPDTQQPAPTSSSIIYYPDYSEKPAPTPTAEPLQVEYASPKTGQGGSTTAVVAVFALALCATVVFGRRAIRSK